MAIASLTCYVDPPETRGTNLPFDGLIEFTRNERGREIVTLNVLPDDTSTAIIGDVLTIRLMKARRDREEEVTQARVTHTYTASNTPVNSELGDQFAFDLRNIVYSDVKPFPIVRRGNYFFKIETASGVTKTTDDFRVCLMTTDRLEDEWLMGTTRRSNDDRYVRFQPRTLTGIRIIEVSRNHPIDLFPLSLSIDSGGAGLKYLSWNDGKIVKLDIALPSGIHRQYILPSRDRNAYIIVQVDPRKIPTSDTTEDLMVDRQLISRETLRRWLDGEAEWLESNFLYVPLDPALVVSDFDLSKLSVGAASSPSAAGGAILPSNGDYDLKTAPTSYYPPVAGHFINLKVPYWRPLHWDYLIGALEHTRIVDINPGFIQQAANGYVNLIPFNQSLAYNFIGLMYVGALRGPVSLPSFWRFRYFAGIEDRTTPLTILEIIGLRAAVKGLAVLGQMFRGGFSSQSVSRDGVSESVSYTASATFGIYSATIEEYKKRLTPLQKQVQRKWYGLTFEGF